AQRTYRAIAGPRPWRSRSPRTTPRGHAPRRDAQRGRIVMTTPRLLHVGSIVVDHVYRIDALPAPGTEVTAQSYQVLPGGGFNLIVAAKRAGLAVAFGGAHGTGVNGDLIRAALKAEGIEILTAPSASMDSGVCTVLVTRDAERSFVSWPG